MVAENIDTTSEAIQLNNFIDEFHKAASTLQWIRDKSIQLKKYRTKRSDGQPLEDNYPIDEDVDSGDSWYSNFRSNECDANINREHCKNQMSIVHFSDEDQTVSIYYFVISFINAFFFFLRIMKNT